MPKFFRVIALVSLLICGSAFSQLAIPINSITNSYIVWNTESEELLPQSSVIAMTQTRNGYLWLGTVKGLVRFDGTRTEVFDQFNTPGLSDSTIVHLFEDSRGGLWVGTEKAGVVLIKDGKVIPQKIGQGGVTSRIASSCEDANGAVWFFTSVGGLYRVRGEQVESMQFRDERLGWRPSVIAEKGGAVWVGTDQALRRIAPDATFENGRFASTVATVESLNFLFASPHGGHWRFTNGRIQKWNANVMERDIGAYGWNQYKTLINAVVEDTQGNLYVGTHGEGVYCYKTSGEVAHISGPDVLNHNTIFSLWLDRDETLWVGTDGGGLNRLIPKRFETFPTTLGKTVQLVCEDGEGGMWFSYNGGGLNYWKGGVLKEFGMEQLGNVNVRSVLVDHNKSIWMGGIFGGGLFRYENGKFAAAVGMKAFKPHVQAMFEDRAKNVWVGAEEGLLRWDGRTWRPYTKRDGMTANSVRAVTEDGSGNLWIGTDGGGLNRLHGEKFTSYRQASNGLPSDSITALLADAEGNLWVGTSGNGLARLRNEKWTQFTKRDGLSGNSITYLIEDGEGFLWIGSNEGLMRVEKKSLNDFADGPAESIQVRTFRKADGLPTKECTTGSQPAACRTRDGHLWFPMTKGLVEVNPVRLQRDTNAPPILIESVLVDDEPQNKNALQVPWTQEVVIPARKERLEIRFTSLNLASPERARFKYRLENHETKWTETRERDVRFTKLPSGEYRFQVTACNEDGVWNPTPATLAIIVEPPFWQKWWFLTICAMSVLGAIVGIVYFISTQKLQRQLVQMRQQEALEKERARIARDLHDQLGANLTQVSLLGEMVETDKDLPQEVEEHAKQISQTARITAAALDEIVWAANPSNDTLEGLVTYACKYAQEYVAVAGLSYRLEAPEKLPAAVIPPDVRHNVFLAFKESVNNVVKHAQAKSVKVRVRLEQSNFIFEIEDDGRGIAPADRAKGRNGLLNMAKRMEDVGGRFSFEPGAQGGTLVRLIAPFVKSNA
jgi:ligand-binding sensor domain-containing protein/signal transduction histidine kinase